MMKVSTYAYSICKSEIPPGLKTVIAATTQLWRQHRLTYDQARYVGKEVRRALALDSHSAPRWLRHIHFSEADC
jgi:YD repeat-containing protein